MKWYMKLIFPLALVAIWEIVALIADNAFILPTVDAVFSEFLSPFADIFGMGNLVSNAIISIERVDLGFIIAVVIAVPLGIFLGSHPFWEGMTDGLVQIFRPIPPLAWVPLSLAWFGIGMTSIVFIIVIGCFFPILVSTIDGIKRVKKSWLETAMIYQANSRHIMRHILLPAAAPAIFNGLRVGFGIAWMSVVAAEMMPGSSGGLGHLIMQCYNYGQVGYIITGMLCIGIIGILVDQIFKLIQRKKLGWETKDK